MRNYDLTLILSPLLSEQEANDQFQKFVSSLQEKGGIMEDQNMLGKKPLLSPIEKAKEAYVATLTFALNEEKILELEKECKEAEHIIRFLLARQPKRKAPAPATPAPVAAVAPAAQTEISEQKKEEKIDLADIDQKLEEMFKE